jgi:hypothetical protein
MTLFLMQAESADDRDVWVQRLQDLSVYWKARNYKMIRDQINKHKPAIIRQDKSPRSKRTDPNADMEDSSVSQYDEEGAASDVIYTSIWNYCIPSRCRYIMVSSSMAYKKSIYW